MTEIDPGTQAPTPMRRSGARRRWGLLGVIVAVGAGVYVALTSGADRTGTGPNPAAGVALGPVEMAGATGGGAADFQRTNPPVDIGLVERAARGATLGRVPMPDSREVVTYHDRATGADVTQAVILYDDTAKAADLVALAAPLLSSSFGLQSTDVTIEGATDAQRWTAESYQAVTFRVDGVIVLVGSNDAGDEEVVMRMAEALVGRARDAAATAAAPTAAPQDGVAAP
jgi:hypothetical protein